MFERLDNYPPGHPTGNEVSEVILMCRNEDCDENGIPREVIHIYERDTGASYIEPEDAANCEVCGEEMDDA